MFPSNYPFIKGLKISNNKCQGSPGTGNFQVKHQEANAEALPVLTIQDSKLFTET